MANGNIMGAWWGKALVAGMVGGAVFGIYEMFAMFALGHGFFAPLNMIGAVFPVFRPPADGFQWAPTLTGLAVHMATSALWGLILALVIGRNPRVFAGFGFSSMAGLFLGIAAWLVTGLVIGPVVDPAVSQAPPLNFFLGHILFGLATTWTLYAWIGGRIIEAGEAGSRRSTRIRPA